MHMVSVRAEQGERRRRAPSTNRAPALASFSFAPRHHDGPRLAFARMGVATMVHGPWRDGGHREAVRQGSACDAQARRARVAWRWQGDGVRDGSAADDSADPPGRPGRARA